MLKISLLCTADAIYQFFRLDNIVDIENDRIVRYWRRSLVFSIIVLPIEI